MNRTAAALIAICVLGQGKAQSLVQVPFVGCESGGHAMLAAPTGSSKSVRLDPVVAAKLAYYKTEWGPGILAPRGWRCYGTIGSSGNSTIVSPSLQDAEALFDERWRGYLEPIVVAFRADGSGSGRLFVAEVIARAFPNKRAFAEQVIRDWDAKEIQFGPYSHDLLTFRSPNHIEFRTPANTKGLGTMRWLLPSADPIDGSATTLNNAEHELVYVEVRLPNELRQYAPSILRQVRAEHSK